MNLFLNSEGLISSPTEKSVVLKLYIPPIPKSISLLTDTELQNLIGSTMIVDTEIYINYFLIAFKEITTNKIILFEINKDTGEIFNERKLSWIMHNYRTIGFNSIKYDLAMIWLSYAMQDTENLKNASDDLILRNIWHSQLQSDYGFKIYLTNHIDLIEVCPLKGSLKLYGARLHAKRIQDLPLNIHEPLKENQIEIVIDYCLNDLDLTHTLFNNLEEQLKLRQDLSIEYRQDLMSKSDAQIAEAVIGSELKKITGKWPKKPKIDTAFFNYKPPAFISFQTAPLQHALAKITEVKYSVADTGRLEAPKEVTDLKIPIGNGVYRIGIGGLHSSEKNISTRADNEFILKDVDVASYYPAIVLNCGLYPQHLGPEFLKVYKTLVDSRLEDKKAKRIAQSECKKITINGTFGKLGSPYSILYSPESMIYVTLTGQLALLMLIEKLELVEISCCSANTDGIMIKCPIDKQELLKQLVKKWEVATGFQTEDNEYEALYSRDVNAYMAVKKDKIGNKKEIKGKNLYYDPWRGKTARDGYWRFQKNPTTQICIQAIEELILKEIPIEETIKSCLDLKMFIAVKNVTGGAHKDRNYLGKTIRWYYAKDILGTINYIKNNHIVPDTEGAKPCMDLPDTFPDDINYEWYEKRTMVLLEDMGYYEKAKQIAFF